MIKNHSESFIKKIKTLNKIYSVSSREINALTERRKNDSTELLQSHYISLNDYKKLYNNIFSDFFLVSLPQQEPPQTNHQNIFIPSSAKYTSQCKHNLCSKLLSIKPSVTSSLSNINSTLTINNSTAHLCFPTGIKICLMQNIFNIPSPKNIFTFITNSDGTRLYIMMYYFYNKIPKNKFISKYKYNSITQYISSFKQTLSTSNNLNSKEMISQLNNQLETCSEIEYTENINIPICACLISKYPYKNQMESILNTFVKLYSDTSRPLYEAIMFIYYIIYSIPYPNNDHISLSFYIPLKGKPIIIESKSKEFRNVNNLYTLIDILSINVIITIFKYILLEKRIILIDNDNYKISFIINCFLELIHPLQWVGILIPLICDDMIEYISSFLPFICGMNKELYNVYKDYIHKEVDKQVIFVYLESGEIKNSSGNKIKEEIKFPKEYKEMLKGGLQFIKKNMMNYPEKEKKVFNKSIRDLFCEIVKDVIDNKKGDHGKFYIALRATQLYVQYNCCLGNKKNEKERNDKEVANEDEECKRFGIAPYFIKRKKGWETFGEVVDYVENNYVDVKNRMERSEGDVLNEYNRVLINGEDLVFEGKWNKKGIEVFDFKM